MIRAFLMAAAWAWNALPTSIRLSPSYLGYCRVLKSRLFVASFGDNRTGLCKLFQLDCLYLAVTFFVKCYFCNFCNSVTIILAFIVIIIIIVVVLWNCPSMLWLGDRKGIQPVKNWVLVCWWWWFDWSFAPFCTSYSFFTDATHAHRDHPQVRHP